MISGEITASILQQKAQQYWGKNFTKASYDIQIVIYQETLVDLEEYLDTGDLRELTSSSLNIIKRDIRDIIEGIRGLRSKIPPGTVNSIDGTLDKLRKARINLDVMIGMFDISGNLKENKSRAFFEQMEKTRQVIETALGLFR